MIYETKEIPDLYFSNQTQFDLKSINGSINMEYKYEYKFLIYKRSCLYINSEKLTYKLIY